MHEREQSFSDHERTLNAKLLVPSTRARSAMKLVAAAKVRRAQEARAFAASGIDFAQGYVKANRCVYPC